MNVRLTGKNAKQLSPEMFIADDPLGILKSSVRSVNIQVPIVNCFGDIITDNNDQLEKDYMLFVKKGAVLGKLHDGVYFMTEDQIYLGKDSLIKSGCVFDAEEWPIYIGQHVTIAPNTWKRHCLWQRL